MTQKNILYEVLKSQMKQDWQKPQEDRGWVRAYHLRGTQTPFGFTGHQADRRLREMAESSIIEHRIKDGYAEYRYRETNIAQKTSQGPQSILVSQEMRGESEERGEESRQLGMSTLW